ncbi:MAG: hypothetical protein J3R72DRAFT_47985 [Linnemannia gamsii]|nr:MAG: hypothetical protein J3R72DRAFT_47985 [Linnemannia gamsii]
MLIGHSRLLLFLTPAFLLTIFLFFFSRSSLLGFGIETLRRHGLLLFHSSSLSQRPSCLALFTTHSLVVSLFLVQSNSCLPEINPKNQKEEKKRKEIEREKVIGEREGERESEGGELWERRFILRTNTKTNCCSSISSKGTIHPLLLCSVIFIMIARSAH